MLFRSEPSSATGNDEITNIITEEAEAFFKGQKSVADVAGVIQSRVQVYVCLLYTSLKQMKSLFYTYAFYKKFRKYRGGL